MGARQTPVPPLLIENDDEFGPSRSVWLLMAALVIAKVALMIAVLAMDFSALSSLFLFLTTWLWIIFGAALVAGPIGLAIRMRRMRSRRTELQRSEWILSETTSDHAPDSQYSGPNHQNS